LAAESGNSTAQFHLGYLLIQIGIDIKNEVRTGVDFQDFVESYEDINAQITTYESYYDFIVRDGMKWLQKSSENGNSSASYHLAQIYEHGFFKKSDMESALEKYKFAANQGHQKSSLYAGNMYFRGVGCDADTSIACKYYLQSSLSGNKDAMNAIGILYEDDESGEYLHEGNIL
jgi:TPR repeat protein